MTPRILAAAAALAVAAAIGSASRAQSRDAASRLAAPPIARIAGIRVGVDNLGALRARLGWGTPMTGSRGFVWSWKAARCLIRATFSSPEREDDDSTTPLTDSDVVRCVSLELMEDGDSRNAAIVRGYVRDLGWMRAVIAGTDRRKLMEATREIGKPEVAGDELIWRASLRPSSGSNGQTATRWAAVVRLKDDRVTCVRVVTP